jgi:hypothetical protein
LIDVLREFNTDLGKNIIEKISKDKKYEED